MISVKYSAKVYVGGWQDMRALAAEQGFKDVDSAAQADIVSFVCARPVNPSPDHGYKISSVESKKTGGYHLLKVAADVVDPDALVRETLSRYAATWPVVGRPPDPWMPEGLAMAVYSVVTNLTAWMDSDYSECFWLESLKMEVDAPLPVGEHALN
jgi:hypothetical protein